MSVPNHEALREALGAYALDAVDDPAERAAIEHHVARCDACRIELDRHRATAAGLAPEDSPLPDGLWTKIEREVNRQPHIDVAPVVQINRRWTPILSAAAAVVLVSLVGVQTFRLQQARDDLDVTRQQLSALQTAVAAGDYQAMAELASAAPGAMTVALHGDAGAARATILPDGSGYLDVHELATLDADSTYQLWAVLDGEIISAAVLGAGDRSVSPFQVDPATLEALVVTREAAGGVAVSSQPAASAWSSGS